LSVKLTKSATVNEDLAVNIKPDTTPFFGTHVKIPVVLAEILVQIPMHSIIKFDHPVLEIKQIKKNVKVTQCRLLQPSHGEHAKLFISGFVRKNIQYASPMDIIDGEINSRILSTTVEIPFEKVAIVPKFLTSPVGPKFNIRRESEVLSHKKDCCDHVDFNEFHQQSVEFFNEDIFCEPIKSEIVEIDEPIDAKPLKKLFHDAHNSESVFTKVEEKMVLDLTVKVLQKQQIKFPKYKTKTKKKKYSKKYGKRYGKKYY
jgi:hypothetical protein